MSVFGQVWVFSAVAFVLGAFLAWLFLVRPAQKRIGELQRRLASKDGAARPEAAQRTRVAPPVRATDGDDDARESTTPPTRHFEPAPEPESSTPEREATEHLAAAPSWPERDSLQGRTPKSEIDELDEDFARLDELDDSLDGNAGGLLDPPTPVVDEPTRIHSARGGELDIEPSAREYADSGGGERRGGSLFEPAPLDEAEDTPPTHAFGDRLTGDDSRDDTRDDEEPVERTTLLPKRQPGRTQMESFEPVKPSQPSMRSVERREPGPQPSRTGSLFEPTVAPSNAAPPARDLGTSGLPSGPFGPGSAMPKPGGGRPSGDFPVKASVTTLRYCTEDSPEYARMVAEVWFRSPADAERVGFRPLPPSRS